MENNASSTAATTQNLTYKFRLPFNEFDVAITSAIVFPSAFFGVVANVITVVVVYRATNLRSIFNHYIMSLCLSDLISAVLSPLYVYRKIWGFDEWNIPHLLCKVFWGGDMATSISTSLHIVAFSTLRFISVAKPHAFSHITLKQAKISIISLWILSFSFGFIPYAVFMGVSRIDRTAPSQTQGWPVCATLMEWLPIFKIYSTYSGIIFFYIPLILIFVQSFATALLFCIRRSQRAKIRKKRPSGREDTAEISRQKKENHAILQLALIVGSFAIGYLPNAIFLAMISSLPYSNFEERRFLWWINNFSFMSLRFSECLNPIFYNLASSKLRAETKKYLSMICGKKRSNRDSGSTEVLRSMATSKITAVSGRSDMETFKH